MSTIDKKAIKVKILAEIEKMKASIVEMKEQTKPISPENAIGRVSRMDAINNKSVVEAALEKAKTKVGKLEASLTNLSNENFGICSRCKNPIQIGRLMYMPESTRCVHCADR